MNDSQVAVLEVDGLEKTFHIGFRRKRVDALRGINFKVGRGEIFGLLGPNGAGKTTAIKIILGLIFATRGKVRIFGDTLSRQHAMRRVGYLPENPYVYQYLRPLEFLDLCGRLLGISKRELSARSQKLVERVGLSHATDRPIGKFSKGMMQRIGLAQALLNDPDFLILDEPMSGLDPIGRKEVRDIILELRRDGKTLLFTSHILSDVEMLCDRVAILQKGRVSAQGKLSELMRPEVRRIDIEVDVISQELRDRLSTMPCAIRELDKHAVIVVEGDETVGSVLRTALDAGVRIRSVVPQRESLESLFLRNAVTEEHHGG